MRAKRRAARLSKETFFASYYDVHRSTLISKIPVLTVCVPQEVPEETQVHPTDLFTLLQESAAFQIEVKHAEKRPV